MAQVSQPDGSELLPSELSNQAVLIIDAMELRRAGVISLLKPWADSNRMRIVATAPHESTSYDSPVGMVLLMVGARHVRDPELQSWIASFRSTYMTVPLVLVSDREEPEEVIAAFEAGARGFIPTSISPSVAIQAFTFIISGGSFFPPTALMHSPRRDDALDDEPGDSAGAPAVAPAPSGLTLRQQEVLRRLQQGESNKLIGRQLKMRESTVKVHIRQIMRKLGAANRTQAALCAVHLSMAQRSSTARDAASPSDKERDTSAHQEPDDRTEYDVPLVPTPVPQPKVMQRGDGRADAGRR